MTENDSSELTRAGSGVPSPCIPSPCIKVCELDPDTRWCRGCLRSAEEIGAWRDADDRLRRDILRRVAARRALGSRPC